MKEFPHTPLKNSLWKEFRQMQPFCTKSSRRYSTIHMPLFQWTKCLCECWCRRSGDRVLCVRHTSTVAVWKCFFHCSLWRWRLEELFPSMFQSLWSVGHQDRPMLQTADHEWLIFRHRNMLCSHTHFVSNTNTFLWWFFTNRFMKVD